MTFKRILFVVALLLTFKTVCKSNHNDSAKEHSVLHSSKLIINNLDSIIFDLSSATLTATYIDIPVYLKSNDVILSFDYALTFNMSKLTFSTVIDLLPTDPSFSSFAYFNSTDLFLRNTSSSQQSIPAIGNVHLTMMRFSLAAPCTPISASDFSNILTILNGTQCSHRVTTLNFSEFIPVANFKTSPGCLNADIQFSDTSLITRGTVTNWFWKFSNTKNSSLQNNILTYTNTGNATNTLIVTASTGCMDTVVKSITISQPPVSSFSYSFHCVKDSVFFNNTSTSSSGPIISSFWYFGDLSANSTLTNPKHRYPSSGHYKVLLTSTSSALCKSTIAVMIAIRPSDINKDGITNVNDFLMLVPQWLTPCN